MFYAKTPKACPIVMLIDDDTDLRFILAELLRPLEIEIMEAENGREALDKLLSRTLPHLIISDLRMPYFDGFEFLENIRNNPSLKDIPVIIVTVDSSEESRNKAHRYEVRDSFAKPFPLDDLLFCVKNHIAGGMIER